MYGSAAVIVITQLPRLSRILRPAAPFLALWGVYAGVATAGAFLVGNETSLPNGSLLAGFENALLPLATITVTFWNTLLPRMELLRVVSWTLAVVMSMNAIVALWTCYAGLDAAPFLPRFWTAAGSDVTVALLAEQMGRFSGIFNQPAEAGVAYSLAAFCLLYLIRTGVRMPIALQTLMWTLIILDGLLTISKIFVIGGVVVATIQLLTDRDNRLRLALSGLATLVAAGAAGVLDLAGSWGASIMLNVYRVSVRAGDSPLYTLSAGRFGSPGDSGGPPSMGAPTVSGATDVIAPPSTELAAISDQVLAHHPWFGVGAKGLVVSYDSAWTEALVVAGVVGVVVLVAVHAALVLSWFGRRKELPRAEWILCGAVVVLVLGSSFGLPSLTGNRESTLLWIFVGLMLFTASSQSPGPSRAEPVRKGYLMPESSDVRSTARAGD